MPLTKLDMLNRMMKAKHHQGERPYVLFLGTGIPVRVGGGSFANMINDLVGSDDIADYYSFIDDLTPQELVTLLCSQQIKAESCLPSPGYASLAKLIKAGYFDLIVTTNIDDSLEISLADEGLRPADYVSVVFGRDKEDEIARLVSLNKPRVKILKLHGDLNLRLLSIKVQHQFQFPPVVAEVMREAFKQDLLLVGYDRYDNTPDVIRCLEFSSASIWYAAEQAPEPSSFVYSAMAVRDGKKNIIAGEEGCFDRLFSMLAENLLQTGTPGKPALTQAEKPKPAIEELKQALDLGLQEAAALAPEDKLRLALALCDRLEGAAAPAGLPLVEAALPYLAELQQANGSGAAWFLNQLLAARPPEGAPLEIPPALRHLSAAFLATGQNLAPGVIKTRLAACLEGRGLLERVAKGRLAIEEAIFAAIDLCDQIRQKREQNLAPGYLDAVWVVQEDSGHWGWMDAPHPAQPEAGPAGDVRAVAAVLFAMLAGTPLPDESALPEGGPLPVTVSPWVKLGLDQILLKALTPDPAMCYPDVIIFRDRLHQHLTRLRQAQEIDMLIRASYPIVCVVSHEEERVRALLRQVAAIQEKPMLTWMSSRGLRDAAGNEVQVPQREDPAISVLDAILYAKQDALYVLFDYHPYLRSSRAFPFYDLVMSEMRRVIWEVRRTGKAVVIVSPSAVIPTECEKDFTVVHLGLPGPGEIAGALDDTIAAVRERGGEISLSRDEYEELLRAAMGLSLNGAQRAFVRACVQKSAATGNLLLNRDAIQVVLHEKERALYKSSALEIFPSPEDFSNIGGLEELKDWAEKRAGAFSIEAQAFGLPAPKGVLIMGVPGCGKSLAAKAIAAAWKKPLVRLDPGALFNSRVGSSEENLRTAIQIAESIAPCVLWIDEIEKSFSGAGSVDDGGVTSRVLGGFMTWLQEKTAPVFVVATANTIAGQGGQGYARATGLPPELLRKGRFDELFFVDLPDPQERSQIFQIHLSKRGHDPDQFDLAELARRTDGFSGAEIEQVVLSALFDSFDGFNQFYALIEPYLPDLENLDESASRALAGYSAEALDEGFIEFFSRLLGEDGSMGKPSPVAEVLEQLYASEQSRDMWRGRIPAISPDMIANIGLTQEHLLTSIGAMRPLSQTMAASINAFRQWAKTNARSASRPAQEPEPSRKAGGPHIEPQKGK